MDTQKYSIIYSSKTGNTKKLAMAIYEILPKDDCEYYGIYEAGEISSEMVYIGFWTDKGNADEETLALLKNLRNKKIFLFGTAGFGGSEEYFQKVLNNVKKSIDASNTVVGEFMCQGKMPQSVKERYIKMKEQPNCVPNIDEMIENFDRALSHPDDADLESLKNVIKKI